MEKKRRYEILPYHKPTDTTTFALIREDTVVLAKSPVALSSFCCCVSYTLTKDFKSSCHNLLQILYIL